MSKTELIEEIVAINHTAERNFLDRFDEIALDEYLNHLLASQNISAGGESRAAERQVVACAAWQADQVESAAATATAVMDAPAEADPIAEQDEPAADEPAEQPAATQTHVFALVDDTDGENWQFPLFAEQFSSRATNELSADSSPEDIAADFASVEPGVEPTSAMINEAHGMFCLDVADCDEKSIIDEFLREPVSAEVLAILNEIKVDIGEFVEPQAEARQEIQTEAAPAETQVDAEAAAPQATVEAAESEAEIEQAEPAAEEKPVFAADLFSVGAITLPVVNPRTQPGLAIDEAPAADEPENVQPVEEVAAPAETCHTQSGLSLDETPVDQDDVAPVADDEIEIEDIQIPCDDDVQSVEQLDEAIVVDDSADDESQEQPEAAEEIVAEHDLDEADLPEAIEVDESDAGMAAVASDEPDICML